MDSKFKNNACPGCDNPKCKSKIKTNSFGRIRITNFFSSTIEELINQVERLKNTEILRIEKTILNAISKMSNNHQYALMSEFWTTEKRGTDIPLKRW